MCKAPSGPKVAKTGQENAWRKIDFNEEMKKKEEGNAVTWKTAAGSRDEKIQPTTGKSKRERCVWEKWFVEDWKLRCLDRQCWEPKVSVIWEQSRISCTGTSI